MEREILVSLIQHNCKHENYGKYKRRSFDIFNGFEMIAIRCRNCHKITELSIRSISSISYSRQETSIKYSLKAKSLNRTPLLNSLRRKIQLMLSRLGRVGSAFSSRIQKMRD